MSYEYSAASGRFEIPNPYRLENAALMIGSAVAGSIGLILVVSHREALSVGDGAGMKAIAVGFTLLTIALTALGWALKQLRYYFGRGRPKNLAGEHGATDAAALKENLRQNALVFGEPQGAINNLLHHLVDTLIFAPRQVRYAAEAQAFNLLLTIAILLGMVTGYLFYPDPAIRSWIAVGFLLVLSPKMLRPFASNQNLYAPIESGVGLVILLIAIPIIGPPLLAQIAPALPDITRFEIGRTLFVSLGILVVSQALFFVSLLHQLRERPTINMACEQRALSMNANPAKLFEELERTLQSRWTETIPNRRYALKKLPDVFSGQSGSFEGEVLEETQPTPMSGAAPTIVEQMQLTANQSVAALTGLGLATFIASVAIAWRFAQAPLDAPFLGSALLLAIVLVLVSNYCFRSAHLLWGRVDFASLLVWVEVRGSFEEAHLHMGNQLTSSMSSGKKVINVESMTLRVWAAELDTVIFHKDGLRDLIGMRGRPDIARFYADHLENFAGKIASVVAPSANTDVERIARMAQAQQMLASSPAPMFAAPQPVAAPPPGAPVSHSPASEQVARRCINHACRQEVPPSAAFCSHCGTRLAPA